MEEDQGNNEPVFIRQNGRNRGLEGYPLVAESPRRMACLARFLR